MCQRSDSCLECPIRGSLLKEKDIESLLKEIIQIEERPLAIQREFIKKIDYLGILDIKKIKR